MSKEVHQIIEKLNNFSTFMVIGSLVVMVWARIKSEGLPKLPDWKIIRFIREHTATEF